ncbi:MAG: hypothetical protein PUK14_02820 [Clostridiales bacterium]|nr:hypothetical protein [Clostridiales bacterium]
MYILELNQEGNGTEIGLFDTIDEGRTFISQIDGYQCKVEDGFVYETINLDKIPDYLELEYNNNIVPITKLMFPEKDNIDVIWKPIPDLSAPGSGMVDGSTRVDAYSIENNDVKQYINRREQVYEDVTKYLHAEGYDVTRAYFGSEDGEAVLYKKMENLIGIS